MCRREAPGVERFARAHADRFTTIGLGTQDDLAMAKDFVKRGGITFRMLWDPTFESWRQLGVRGQPAALLIDGNGTPLQSWFGPFDEDEVLALTG